MSTDPECEAIRTAVQGRGALHARLHRNERNRFGPGSHHRSFRGRSGVQISRWRRRFHRVPVAPSREAVAIPGSASAERGEHLDLAAQLGDELEGIDLLVTTTFHAAEVLDAADRFDKPAAIVQFNPVLVEIIERRLEKGPLTFVVLDPLYRQRLQLVFGANVRTICADDRDALARLTPAEPVVVSRAAKRVFPQIELESLLPMDVPVIAPDCARELAHWLVHLNLAAGAS